MENNQKMLKSIRYLLVVLGVFLVTPMILTNSKLSWLFIIAYAAITAIIYDKAKKIQ
jgi:hypothetical protein